MARYRLTTDAVVFPNGEIVPGTVDVADGRIEGAYRRHEAPSRPWQEIVLPHLILAPGFIDLHVNGAGGHTFEETAPEGIATILATLSRSGTTALVGALNMAPKAVRDKSLERLQAWSPSATDLVDFLGVYLEGPYYHPQERGVHPVEWLHDPDPVEYGAWLDRFGGIIRVFSLAPELEGGIRLVEELVRYGIVAAVGH